MAYDIKQLAERGEKLLNGRASLLSYWQHVGEQFYPERANFLHVKNVGEDFSDNLTTSYPVIARRNGAEVLSSVLRNRNQKWFKVGIRNAPQLNNESKVWLERATETLRNIFYDPSTKLIQATKECDHDFFTFGNGVISIDADMRRNSILARSWHLRDVAWAEDYDREINEIVRRSKVSVSALNNEFKGNISKELKELLEKNPHQLVEYCHYVLPAERWEDKQFKTPFVSIYYESKTKHILRKEGARTKIYCIPRWETVSDSQYAYSPAIIAALPDARLLQQMTLSLLEAGEMAIRPPLFMRQEAIRGDIQNFAGGITALDLEAEQDINDAMKFQQIDTRGISSGSSMAANVIAQIDKAMYLDRMTLPPTGPEMTAFEVSQRVTEYIRNAIPIFEPIEQNYNAPLLSLIFETALEYGAFGPTNTIPQQLQGRDIDFVFESPVSEALEKQKANIFMQGINMGAQVEQIAAGSIGIVKIKEAFAESLDGIGFYARWIHSEEEIAAQQESDRQQQQAAAMLQLAQQGGDAAQSAGAGVEAMSAAGLM